MLFIFDMGGVVTNTFELDSLYNKLKMTKSDFFSICKKNHDIWNDFQTGKLDSQGFWAEFNKRIEGTDHPLVEHDLFRLYFHPSKNPVTVDLIKALKKKHRVVCGTNTIQSHWENHMERGDYSFFNQTYASNKIGAAKPDPLFFKLILEAEGYSPSETFFTDDRIENVEAALSLGINAVQFKSAEELVKLWNKYC